MAEIAPIQESMLSIDGLVKTFRAEHGELVHAVNDIHLEVKKGEVITLLGPSGCGKTHLAAVIAGNSLDRDRPVFYTFVPSLLDHLRSTFSPDSPIGYDELFEQLKTAPLLILDDLGAESSTPWAEDKLYQIVVHRHEARLPTVITTVLSTEEIEQSKPRIASRLVDSMVVDWEPITAPNYRDQRRERRSAQPTVPRLPRRDRATPTRN